MEYKTMWYELKEELRKWIDESFEEEDPESELFGQAYISVLAEMHYLERKSFDGI